MFLNFEEKIDMYEFKYVNDEEYIWLSLTFSWAEQRLRKIERSKIFIQRKKRLQTGLFNVVEWIHGWTIKIWGAQLPCNKKICIFRKMPLREIDIIVAWSTSNEPN